MMWFIRDNRSKNGRGYCKFLTLYVNYYKNNSSQTIIHEECTYYSPN